MPLPPADFEINLALRSLNLQTLAERIGTTIREMRIARGYSQLALAEKIGSHRTHVSRVEQAQVIPTLALLVRIVAALGVEGILVRVRC